MTHHCFCPFFLFILDPADGWPMCCFPVFFPHCVGTVWKIWWINSYFSALIEDFHGFQFVQQVHRVAPPGFCSCHHVSLVSVWTYSLKTLSFNTSAPSRSRSHYLILHLKSCETSCCLLVIINIGRWLVAVGLQGTCWWSRTTLCVMKI